MNGKIDLEAVKRHGEAEGHFDYDWRAYDVERRVQEPEWAWPLVDADAVYINHVGIDTICKDIGIPEERWSDVALVWCVAFRKGYEAAHAAELSP